MLALRFHNWELLDRSMFMSVEPLGFGSILDSKDFNSYSILTVFLSQMYVLKHIYMIPSVLTSWRLNLLLL